MTDKENIKNIVELFIAWNGETEVIDVANLDSAIDFIADSLQEKPVSENLEEAAEDYAATDEVLPNGKVMINFQAEKAFRAGAKWQKEQMMKDAVEVQVNNDPLVGRYINMSSSVVLDTLNQLNSDKAKLIIIKED